MFWQDNQPTEPARAALTVATKLTLARECDPEHFLVALLDAADGALVKACGKLKPGVNIKALRDTLVAAITSSGQPITGTWTEQLNSARTKAMLTGLAADPAWQDTDAARQQRLLAAAAVAAAKPRVRNLFTNSGVPADDLVADLRRAVVATARPAVLPEGDAAEVNRQAFDPAARAVLRLIESEGKGLGLTRVGTPLLLFALLSRENGLLERGLRLQVLDPKQLHQNLLLHLRALGKNRFNEAFALNRQTMQPSVIRILERAADSAHELEQPAVGEADLIKALLLEDDPFVQTTLAAAKVNVKELTTFALQRRSGEEAEDQADTKPLSLAEVEQRLRQRVVGQDHVIDALLPFLKRMRFGYARRGRPMGVMLFLGMSGTGKTQLAKEIARAVYGSEEQLIFLEMGQFGSEYSKTIFVGAPPGLVGYGQGLLTNGLRDKPESVVLFDEVEKAHKSVFDVVLRFLDEGMIADPAGPVRDGQRCIIILTSNKALDVLGPHIEEQTANARDMTPAHRESIRAEVRKALLRVDPLTGEPFFRPEFINRVDELLLFNTFTESAYHQIIREQLRAEQERLRAEKNKEVTFDDELVGALVRQCVARSDEGARVCGKLVSNLVVTPLIDFFVDEANAGVERVRVGLRHGNVEIRPGGTR